MSDVKCSHCQKVVPFQSWVENGDEDSPLDMGLRMTLHGGYAEFADTDIGEPVEHVLCHACGHMLTAFLNDPSGYHFPFEGCPEPWATTIRKDIKAHDEEQRYRDSAVLQSVGYAPQVELDPRITFVLEEDYWDSYWIVGGDSSHHTTYAQAIAALNDGA